MESRLIDPLKPQPLIQRYCPARLLNMQGHRPARNSCLSKQIADQATPDTGTSILGHQRNVGQPDLGSRSHHYELADGPAVLQDDPEIDIEQLDLVMPLQPAKLQLQECVLLRLIPSECSDLVGASAAIELVEERFIVGHRGPQCCSCTARAIRLDRITGLDHGA